MIEPWEDPWAPAPPARPRRNGTKGAEEASGGESGTEEGTANAQDAVREPKPRRWSRPPPESFDVERRRPVPPARSVPEQRAAGDDRSDAEDQTAPLQTVPSPSVPIDKLARWALPLALDTSDHLDLSGHRSTVQDLLETEPPSIRFLLWPRRGPLDASEGPRRHSLELALERGAGDLFVARSWADDRRADASIQGRIAAGEADRDWFDRQLVHFVERVLSLA